MPGARLVKKVVRLVGSQRLSDSIVGSSVCAWMIRAVPADKALKPPPASYLSRHLCAHPRPPSARFAFADAVGLRAFGFGARVVDVLEAVEAVAAVTHYLAGLAETLPSCLASSQQSDLGADNLLFSRHRVLRDAEIFLHPRPRSSAAARSRQCMSLQQAGPRVAAAKFARL